MSRLIRVVVSLAVVLAGISIVTLPFRADAQYAAPATSAGRLTDAVDWFQWGAIGDTIPAAGTTKTMTRTVGGQTLATTCTIGAITSANGSTRPLTVYRSGSYALDTLDDLYNVGGTGTSNTLAIGLLNNSPNDALTVPVSCTAALDGTNVAIPGLVFADAENTDTPAGQTAEFLAATAPAAATWRVIDRYQAASCTTDSTATLSAANKLTFARSGPDCAAGAEAYADGASSFTVTLKANTQEAFAVGVMLPVDHGDAPASYGDAAAFDRPAWTGGTLTTGTTTDVSASSFALATPVQPTPRLGANVDPDNAWNPNTAATGDDTTGSALFGGPSDEDGVTVPTTINVGPGGTYTQKVTCAGSGAVAGWIDWNADGDFGDPGEQSTNTPTCDGTSVTLSWTVPAGVITSSTYLRVRTATAAADVAKPTGTSADGEVEDYAINVSLSAPLSCSNIYAVQGAAPRNIYQVNPATGALTATGAAYGSPAGINDGTTFNATGISNDGSQIYSVVPTAANASINNIYDIDRTSNSVKLVGSQNISNFSYGNFMGAVNPRTGVYYFGGIDPSNRVLTLYGYNPATASVLGVVASGVVTAGVGTSGDIAFDNQNNLYVATAGGAAGAGTVNVSAINETLPTTAGNPISLTTKSVVNVSDSSATSAPLVVGLAVGGQGSRRLYLTSNTAVRTINPSTGAVESVQNFPAGLTVNDAASCSSPDTIDAQASFPNGRANPNDQTTVTITGGGVAANNTGTTAGTDTGVQNTPAETAGTVFGIDGTTYTATQTTSYTNPADYATTYSCTDLNSGTVLTSGTGNVATFVMPSSSGPAGTAASCVFTNTPLVPQITLKKSAGTPSGQTPGSTVPYSFLVTNTGNVALSSVSVSDAKIGTVTCPAGTLAPGAAKTCTGTYTLTQADVDAGKVVNTATAAGVSAVTGLTAPNPTATDTNTLSLASAPAISLVKNATPNTGADGRLNAGDTIAYTFTVTNTGNVTLSGVAVTDAKVGTVSCPATSLASGASTTCTAAAYTVTQADVDAGSVNNTASVKGTPPTGAAVTATATKNVPTSTTKSITLKKNAGAIADSNSDGIVGDAGDKIPFTFTVTNTGDVTLNPITVTDTKVSGISCPVTQLAPGATTTCTSTAYTITQADVDAGAVNNTASVSGTPPSGTAVTATSSTSTATSTASALTLTKSAGTPVDANGDKRIDAGDTIVYSFLVKNTGSLTLTVVGVTDGKVGTVTCSPTTLAPGASVTCTAPAYTITQADVDAGAVNNSATAAGTTPQGTRVTSPASTTSTSTTNLRTLLLNKAVGATTDVNKDGRVDAGDTIGYTFTVTNTGTVTESNVAVTDSKIASVTCPSGAGSLAPGAAVTCTGTYTVTQADVDTGAVNNTAGAKGTPPGTTTPITSNNDNTSTPTSTTATLTLVKSVASQTDTNQNGRVDAGDKIAYSFVVTNSGDKTLTGVAVTDAKAGTVTCPAGASSLAPGASVTCTATYTITQADVDAGSIVNTATATGKNPAGTTVTSSPSTATVTTSSASTLTLTKTAGTPTDTNANGRVDAGDKIPYSFLVTNTGAVTVTTVAITDSKLSTAAVCPVTTLAPGAQTTCTGTYTITQADVNTGTVANTATATGKSPAGATVTSNSSSTSTATSTVTSLLFDKQAAAPVDVNNDNRADAGDTVDYSFVITNTGAQTLSGVGVTDDKIGAVTCPAGAATLLPGATVTCTKTYTITQADVNAGGITNTASSSATSPAGTSVKSNSDSTTTATSSASTLTLTKSAGTPVDVNGNKRVDAGDTIAYSFLVKNTGSVTITGVAITDSKLTTAATCPAGAASLAPNASVTCTATYTITQADVDSGTVKNTATASGKTPAGATTTSASSSTTTATSTTGSLGFTKTAGTPVDVNGNGRTDAGDTIAYTFVATNTGAQTLTNVGVTDAKIGAVTCPAGATSLAPGASVTCTKNYAITQADVDAGAVNNTASASGTSPAGAAVTSATASTSTPTSTVAALSFKKTAGTPSDVNGNGRVDAGDTIAYSFLVTNTGVVTISNVAVADAKVGAVTCPAGATSLAPQASVTCTKTYTITQADVNAGSVNNTASASGTAPGGATVTSPNDSTTTATSNASGLVLTKTAGTYTDTNGDKRLDTGDTIPYTFVVQNTGAVTLTGLTINDPKTGAVTCPVTTLAGGDSTTCTKTYTVTQADVDSGKVVNSATVSGTNPGGTAVTSNTSTVTTTTSTTASLTMVKKAGTPVDANNDGSVDAGDTIVYTFAVTNTGDVTLSLVGVNDPKTGTVTCNPTTLSPATTVTCTSSYTITQADVDAGGVNNTAAAFASTPSGTQISSSPSSTTSTTTSTASFTLDKQAAAPTDVNKNGRVDAGDTIAYSFVVVNTGTLTLKSLVINDSKTTATCPVTTLAPGATTTCTASYTITQADVNSGAVNNTATATATPPTGAAITTQPDSTATSTSAITTLALTKTAGTPVDVNNDGRVDAGDTIAYSFLVRNTGAQTITGIAIADTKLLTAATCPAGATSLAPGASVTCTGTYTITQAEVNAGTVNNTARATGKNPAGTTVTSNSSSTATATSTVRSLDLDKQAGAVLDANNDGKVDVGDTIAYAFVITNTGAQTLTAITVADNKIGAVTCPAAAATLLPGATVTCTKTYAITQADIDAGAVNNTATSSGTPPTGPAVTSGSDSTSTTLTPAGAITLDLTSAAPVDANGDKVIDAGDTIAYSYLVANTGTVTLSTVGDTDTLGNTVVCPTTTLAPGASVTCTATHTITQAEVDAGKVVDTATATGKTPTGTTVTSATDTETTTLTSTSTLTVDKQAAAPTDVNKDGRVDAGDTIAYSFVVVNTGTTTLTGLKITDSLLTATCPTTTLAPGAGTTCTASYTITQADVNAGTVNNTATGSATAPGGATVTSAADSTSSPTSTTSSLSLVKSAGTPTDVNKDGRVDAGDTIAYTFKVTNTGDRSLTAVTVGDAKVGTVTCPVTTLDPGAATTCTATYTITQADVNSGAVANTATATGTAPGGAQVTSAPSSTSTPTSTTATLGLTMVAGTPGDANGDGRVDAGDTITYALTVTNTGAVTLTGLAINDPKLGTVTCPVTTLQPGGSTTCTVTYTITQADVNSGSVVNTATATGTPPTGAAVTSGPATTTTPTTTTSGLTLRKSAATPVDVNGDNLVDAGDTIAYSFALTNTGAVTLTGVAVSDPKAGAVTCPTTTLAPAATTTCTATYTITQADVDGGAVTNTATASGTPPTGPAVQATDSVSVATASAASLAVDKQAAAPVDKNGNGRIDAGDTIAYSFVATNTGVVTLSGLTITDSKVTATCPVTTLAPGKSTTCVGTYTLTQADLDSGAVDNTASGSALPPTGVAVTSPTDSTSTPLTTTGSIDIALTGAAPVDVDGDGVDVGDTVAYSYLVTNTSNVTLTTVGVTDSLGNAITCPAAGATLAPGASTTCTSSYPITQADVDAGKVTDTATTTGTTPAGVPVTASDTTTVSFLSTSSITVNLTAGTPTDVDGNGIDPGDTITYSYLITNTGTTPLDTVGLTDSLGDPIRCPTTTVGAGAQITCTATYVLTQADVDAGAVTNTATASGTPPAGTPVTATDSTSTPLTVKPGTIAISLDGAAPTDVDGNGIDAGDTIAYTYTLTNTGNVTLSTVGVTDTLGNTITCPATTLAAAASITCTATYTLTQADVDAGTVKDTATDTGTTPTGTQVSASATTSTPVTSPGSIQLDLTGSAPTDLDGNGIDRGDTITYTYVVTNTSNVNLSTVRVTDSLGDTVVCPTTTLAPGASQTCTATYTLTQADVDAGQVKNQATTRGVTPTGVTVLDTETVTTPFAAGGAIDLALQGSAPVDGDGNGIDVGDTINYTYDLTNTSNVDLSTVGVTDSLGNTITCPATTLAPGATITCTAAYTLTQADVDAGTVSDTATTTGVTPSGTTVSDSDSTTKVFAAPNGLSVDMTAGAPADVDGNGIDAGDTIAYTYTVTNTGNTDLSTLTLTDSLGNVITCPATSVAPGATITCTATYTLTQNDIDAGSVANSVTATATTSAGTTITATDQTATPVTTPGAITIDLRASAPNDVDGNGIDVGDTISYTYLITNSGNSTLSTVGVTDSLGNTITCPAAGATLAPGASTTCTATYVLTQADVNAGVVNDTATTTGTTPAGTTVTATDSTDTPFVATGSLDLVLSGTTPNDLDGNGTDVGDTISYTYAVTNTSNVTITLIGVTDSLGNTVTCPTTTLAPGATQTCTSTYVLTQADVNAGQVTDTATTTGTTPTGASVTDADTAVTSFTVPAGITVAMTAGTPTDVDGNGIDAGDTITYTYTVTNTGNVPVSTVGLTDSLGNPITCSATSVAIGATITCTATYTITQADVDAGSVVNTVTGTGTVPSGATVTGTDTTATPLTAPGAIAVTVQGAAPTDLDGNGIDVGDTIAYTYTVTNTSNVTLSSVGLTDSLGNVITCPATTLAPGATITCTSTYTLTQADVNAGSVKDTATTTGVTPGGTTVTDTDSQTTTFTATGTLSLDKQAGTPVDQDKDGRVDAGDTITYSFVVTNTGNRTVTGITVDDSKVGAVTCPTRTLPPGATTTCTAAYTITQADVDSGAVDNTATVSGALPAGGGRVTSAPDSTSTTTSSLAALTVDKQAGAAVDVNKNGLTDAGDTVPYTFTVTNTGAVTLTGVTVNDSKVGAVTCPTTTLAPGASTTCTASYTITQSDVNSGAVTNTATASGTPPTGAAVTSPSDTVVTPTTTTTSLTVLKKAGKPVDVDGDGRVDAGDTIDYTFTVDNLGTVPLTAITVNDAKVGTVTCPSTTLAPGAREVCTATYTITQADVNSGSVDNVATVSGTPPTGPALTSAQSSTSTPTSTVATLSVDKKAGTPIDANNDQLVDAGDAIPYTFTVTNTGAVTLTGVTVNDSKVGAVTCPTTTLAPGASVTCSAQYTITAADVTNGSVVNTATASGTPPTGAAVTSAPDTVTTPTSPIPNPGLSVVKTAAPPVDVNADGRVDAGDTITYAFLVTDTGDTDLTGVRVNDAKVGAVTCPTTTLAAGASETCTATYTITAADVATGKVVNTATASGTPPTGAEITSAPSTVTTLTTPVPGTKASLTVDKSAAAPVDVNGDGVVDAGDTIKYSFLVTNTGDVTLTDVAIDDPMLTVTCPTTTLAPGAVETCTKTYTITAADVTAGAITNTATVTAVSPAGAVITSPPDTAVTQVPSAGAKLSLVKKVRKVIDTNADGQTDAGDQVVYEFVVTNTGKVTVHGITVDDPMLTRAGVKVTCPSLSLKPGATETCVSGRYTITRRDAVSGTLVNVASVSALGPVSGTVSSTTSTVSTVVAGPAGGHHQGGGTPLPTPPSGTPLPNTGSPIVWWMPAGGALLLALGLLLLLVARRRRDTDADLG